VVSVCDAISVRQQASGRLQQTLYVRGEIVLHAHNIVRVGVCVCVCVSGNSYLYHHIGDPANRRWHSTAN